MALVGDVSHVAFCFVPFGDLVRVSATYVHGFHQMTIRSEIDLDAPDGAPR
jgi:hypothetical protein